MATLNDYGDDKYVDESIGDVVYNEIEDKVKQEAKDAANTMRAVRL